MTYKEYDLFIKFLWNQVNYKEFKELLEMAIGHDLEEGYAQEKWKNFQNCPPQFVQGFERFFEATVAAMEAIDYKG
jgi:hypothetical protein